jgi:hypothetical protein
MTSNGASRNRLAGEQSGMVVAGLFSFSDYAEFVKYTPSRLWYCFLPEHFLAENWRNLRFGEKVGGAGRDRAAE